MKFLDLALKRQSVRRYRPDPVDRAAVDRCLEAARLAPSACNGQPWHFIVVDEPALRQQVAEKTFGRLITFNHFALQAPVVVLVAADAPRLAARIGGAIKQKNFALIDIGMAVEHFCLQAAEEGLGTCILGWFAERATRKLLGLPRSQRVVLAICLGHPADGEVRPKNRKPLEKIRSYNR